MISKHYCPTCDSFDLIKLRRNFIHKHVLDSVNKLQCRDCGSVFKPDVFEDNIPKEAPAFNEMTKSVMASQPKAAVIDPSATEEVAIIVPKKAAVAAAPTVIRSGSMRTHDLMSEDNFQVTETVLSRAKDTTPLSKKIKVHKAPPKQSGSGDEKFVDEIILINEKKALWPYMFASLLVFLGTAYAFLWMPMTLNAGEKSAAQVDMTIGEPNQALAAIKKTAPVTSVKPDEVSPVVPTKSAQVISKEPLVKVAANSTDKPIAKKPLTLQTDSTAKMASLQTLNPRLQSDLGTKADKALGGLSLYKDNTKAPNSLPPKTRSDVSAVTSIAKVPVPQIIARVVQMTVTKTNISLMDVPIPDASVRRYVTPKVKKPTPALAANVTKQIKPARSVKRKTIDQENLNKQTADSNVQLLEQVAVKLMEQDLDKLLLK